MALFATPVAISIYFFSDSIIHLIFGEKYNLSIPLVKLFSFFIYLRFIETPFTLFYIGLHKHKKMVWFQGATSLLNLILNKFQAYLYRCLNMKSLFIHRNLKECIYVVVKLHVVDCVGQIDVKILEQKC